MSSRPGHPGRPPGRKTTQRLPFKDKEITRCVRAAQTLGMSIASIVINPVEGTIVINPGTPEVPGWMPDALKNSA